MSMADTPTFATSASTARDAATRTMRAVFSRLTNHHSITPASTACDSTVAHAAPSRPSP